MSEQPEVPELPVREVLNEDVLYAEAEAEVTKHNAEVEAQKAALEVMTHKAALDPTAAAMLRIAQSMEAFMQRGEAQRQKTVNEVAHVTPWNPEGKRQRAGFTRPTYQHGIPLDPLTCTEETIRLFNQLKPGRYLDRKIEVQQAQDGAINLQWAGQRIDQRIEFYSRFGHIDDVLRAVIAERKVKEEAKKLGRVEDTDYLA